jgi:transcription antitermination factor NusG
LGKHTDKGWFVIQTNPQCEKKADGELRRAGLRVYLPKRSYEVKDRRNHKETTVRWRPLLIGYLFVRFPDHLIDRWGNPPFGMIRDCQGVKGFVKVANEVGEWEPFAVPDKAVAEFMRRQRNREFGRPAVINRKKRLATMREQFRPGARHRVTDGPFASFLATLERLNDNMTLDVEVNILGRAARVRLDIEDIDPKALDESREAA